MLLVSRESKQLLGRWESVTYAGVQLIKVASRRFDMMAERHTRWARDTVLKPGI